jgi:hypothetical protein
VPSATITISPLRFSTSDLGRNTHRRPAVNTGLNEWPSKVSSRISSPLPVITHVRPGVPAATS